MKTLTNGKIAVSALSVQAAVLFLVSLAQPGCADPAPIIHYAPAENLEHIDVALIDRAEHEIDMAAYVLTDCGSRQDSKLTASCCAPAPRTFPPPDLSARTTI
jgi:hypothetical protein